MRVVNLKNYRDRVTKERWMANTEREVSQKRGEELIAKGVAREIGRFKGPRPEYSADMNANDLKAMMSKVGLKFKTAMKKVDMVAMLDEYWDAWEKANEEVDADV